MRQTKSLALTLSIAIFLATLSLPSSVTLGIGAGAGAATLDKTYGSLPMSFEKNVGQGRAGVDFMARGSGYSVFLASGEAVLTMRERSSQEDATIRMALAGSRTAKAAGEDRLLGKANYFVGNDPAKWHRDVPTFAKVRYADVYPGIDVVYYGNQRQLEYDFIVAPGADSGAIALDFTGASIEIKKDGDLALAMSGGSLSMPRPYIYQEIDGTKRVVAGGYVKRADGRIGFAVDSYDTAKPLVIDPVLLYSTYFGYSPDNNANINDSANGIAIDQFGNAYITGNSGHGGGTNNSFVAKIDPSGSALVYSIYFGGSDDDVATGIAVDGSGQAYVSGRTKSANFPITPGAYQTNYLGGNGDAFVAKFNASGSALMYSTYVGGTGYDEASAIAIDTAGNAYITGGFYASDYPTTPGAYQTVTAGAYDAFITKLNASGSALVYSTYLAANGDEGGASIAVDSLGNAYVTGSTNGSNFPAVNALDPAFGGDYDAFVAKLNPNGSALVYSSYLGGSKREFGRGIAVDALGNAYIAGNTYCFDPNANDFRCVNDVNDFPTTAGAYQTAFAGSGDAFVVKLNPSGSAFVYSTYLGGPGGDTATAIAVDTFGNAYVTGNNLDGGFPLTDALQSTYHTASFEGFVAKLSPNGAVIVYSTYFGGAANDLGLGIAVDSLGRAYVAGSTQSTHLDDFPTTPGAYQGTNAGFYDAYVAKIDAAGLGKITGGGSIEVPGKIGTFGFTVQRTSPGAPIKGDLQYVNHATGTKVHSVTISSFSVANTTATFSGTCVSNGVPCTFSVQVSDNGEPGTMDTFTISVSGGPAEGGTLRSGNIQIR